MTAPRLVDEELLSPPSVYVNLRTGKGHSVRDGYAACGVSLGNCVESQHGVVTCKKCRSNDAAWKMPR